MYEVGFKDVYPWVWSVMLGEALTQAERRAAFKGTGTHSFLGFWVKNFNHLQGISSADSSLASQSIPSWNQIISWLKEMETLRTIAA